MSKLLWSFPIILLAVACATSLTRDDLPIHIGETRQEVRAALGAPNRTAEDFDSFYDFGLVIGYSDNDHVVSVTASRLTSGVEFQGKLFGVSIGDPVATAVEAWGPSLEWEETPFEYSRAYFRDRGYRIELEVWSEYGYSSAFGSYESGTIKRIKITR